MKPTCGRHCSHRASVAERSAWYTGRVSNAGSALRIPTRARSVASATTLCGRSAVFERFLLITCIKIIYSTVDDTLLSF